MWENGKIQIWSRKSKTPLSCLALFRICVHVHIVDTSYMYSQISTHIFNMFNIVCLCWIICLVIFTIRHKHDKCFTYTSNEILKLECVLKFWWSIFRYSYSVHCYCKVHSPTEYCCRKCNDIIKGALYFYNSHLAGDHFLWPAICLSRDLDLLCDLRLLLEDCGDRDLERWPFLW